MAKRLRSNASIEPPTASGSKLAIRRTNRSSPRMSPSRASLSASSAVIDSRCVPSDCATATVEWKVWGSRPHFAEQRTRPNERLAPERVLFLPARRARTAEHGVFNLPRIPALPTLAALAIGFESLQELPDAVPARTARDEASAVSLRRH